MKAESRQPLPAYSDYAIAFLDVIGFTDMVDRTTDKNNPQALADIAQALLRAQNWLLTFKGEAKEVYVQTFSDTTLICLSTPVDLQLHGLISGISLYQCSMVMSGNVLRGSLAVGDAFRSGNVMFGPAIIEAHHAERKAVWPRVILASSVLQRLEPVVTEWETGPYIITDEDGSTYVDYLMEGCLLMTANQWGDEYISTIARRPPIIETLLSRHKDAILSLREKAGHSSEKLAKCHCLAKYHNATVVRLDGILAGWGREGALEQTDMRYLVANLMSRCRQSSACSGGATISFIGRKLEEGSALRKALNAQLMHLPSVFPVL